MPNAFRKVVEGMRHSRGGVLPSAQAFPAIDEDQLARQLRLDDRGAEDGAFDLPAPEDDDRQGDEAAARGHVFGEAAGQGQGEVRTITEHAVQRRAEGEWNSRVTASS